MSRKLDQIDLDELSETKKIKSDNNNDDEENLEGVGENDDENFNFSSNEALYGIKETINKNFKKFNGIIKHSPSDFIVNEIDLEENIVHLTNFDIPVIESALDQISFEELEKLKQNVINIIGKKIFDDMIKFLESETKTESFMFDAPKEKSDRKLVHDFIKNNFEQFVTNTIQKDKENQLIEISHNRFNRNSNRDSFKNNLRNKEMGDNKFCICALYKENIDTIQAVNLVSKHLGINIKRIGYSGTKDKRAKTTQLLSFFKIEPKQLQKINNNFHNIKLGNFKLSNEGLKLGDLSGNRFKLVIREISETNDDLIMSGLESLKKNGFINYFGLQRFGNCNEIPTHMIGKYLILNNIKEAIDLILKPRNNNFEKAEIKKAREVWITTSDANRALSHIQRINCLEKFLLNGISKSNKNDYLGAFQFIPRNMRLMYLHAYQSYIWNEATSKRIFLYGLKPCIGDLVRKKIPKTKNLKEKDDILILNEDNLNDYSIEDVVLPLPGHNVLLPQNKIKEFYEELMDKDGIKIESFKNKIKDFCLSGDYRNIVVKPNDLKYEIKNYDCKTQILSKSDWDLLNPNYKEEKISEPENEFYKYKAICLEYSLPTSAYATMALREILNEAK